MLQFIIPLVIGGYTAYKWLSEQDDDDGSSIDYGSQARQQAEADAAEQQRRQAAQAQAERRHCELQAIEQSLRSLCQRFELAPCDLATLQQHRDACTHQMTQALKQQAEREQQPVQQRRAAIHQALTMLEQLV